MPLMKLLWSRAVEFYHVSPAPRAPSSVSPMCNVSKWFGSSEPGAAAHWPHWCRLRECESDSEWMWSRPRLWVYRMSDESRCLPNRTRGPVALWCVLPANVSLFLAGCQTACRGGALGLWEVNIHGFSPRCQFAVVEEKEENLFGTTPLMLRLLHDTIGAVPVEVCFVEHSIQRGTGINLVLTSFVVDSSCRRRRLLLFLPAVCLIPSGKPCRFV